MAPGPRPRRRTLALLVVAALAAAGLVAAVRALTGCPGDATDRALPADSWAGSAVPAESVDVAAELDGRLAAGLQGVGLRTEPRWGLWQEVRTLRGGDRVERDVVVDAVAVTGGLVVTLQQVLERGASGTGPMEAVLAAHDAATGALRWQLGWDPVRRTTSRLVATAAGRLLVVVDEGATTSVAAVDTGAGRVLWCAEDGHADAATSVLAADADQVVVAVQDGADSSLRVLDAATGDDRWRTGYEDHNKLVRPAVGGGTVIAYVVPAGGGRSLLQAYDVATGQVRWTAAADPPGLLGGGPGVAVVAGYAYSGTGGAVDGLDPATGARRWTAAPSGQQVDGVEVLDAGVLVWTRTGRGLDVAMRLLDATTGAERWSVVLPDAASPSFRPLRLTGPDRLLVAGNSSLATVDVATGAARSARASAFLEAADPTGPVVVGRLATTSDLRVTVLATPAVG